MEKKLKHNIREKEFQEKALQDGWNILYKGWPDFLCYKENSDGSIESFFIEIKRNPYKPNKKYNSNEPTNFIYKKGFAINLSPEQQEMHRVLKKLGFDVKVIHKD